MCGQGPFSNRGYDPYSGAFVDLMAMVVPEALPVIRDTSGPSTEPLPKGVSARQRALGAPTAQGRY